MEEKNTSKIEENIKTILRLFDFVNTNYNENYNINESKIIRKIIASLNDPKAKIANRLSLSRIPLGLTIPLTAYFTKNQLVTLTMSSFYAISDFLDGFYSKHIIKHPTEGGTYLDAICDKIGALELIISAIPQNKNILINGILETIIAKTNTKNTNEETEVKSTKLGKVKMWPLSLALICTYMSITGLETKNLKISKEEFKELSNILISVSAILELINIKEYKDLNKEKSLILK